MITSTYLSVHETVREVLARCGGAGPDAIEMSRFLTSTRLDPGSLQPWVRFAPDRYTRHLVWKSPEVEVLVLCWAAGARAPIHGHEGELCWARVERGALRFANYREVSRSPLTLEAVGSTVVGAVGHLDGPADLHAVDNSAELGGGAVSLHVYCKPYDECDIYDVEHGLVRRVRLSYDSVPEPGSGLGVIPKRTR